MKIDAPTIGLTWDTLRGVLKTMASERSTRAGARERDGRGAKIAELKGRWTEYLRHNRLKTTGQREAIVEEFLRSHGHVSIDEVLTRVRRKHARVGHATVYR